MEEKKFTLRLSAQEIEALEQIKRNKHIQADSKAIRYVLLEYLNLENKLLKKSMNYTDLEMKHKALKFKVDNLSKALNDIINI